MAYNNVTVNWELILLPESDVFLGGGTGRNWAMVPGVTLKMQQEITEWSNKVSN